MFVITQTCCSDAACVSVCPVNCIHPTPEERGFGSSDILHIDPEACIDCGACADACPVDAIYPADKLGTRDKVFIEINASYYRDNTDVTSGWTPISYPVIPKVPAGLRVALVGTGPSGGYALRTLLDRSSAQVTVIDKLPTPGGLVRAGVAPDHPGTKKVLQGFDLLYRDPRVTMATNVEIGDDVAAGQITPAELGEHFDGVIYAVGASDSRRLGIPGEDLPGSTSATDLVAWYNSAPDSGEIPVAATDRSGRVVVIGTGNVALDVARILVSPPEILATTDIADRALDVLREQNVREVIVVGRKDQAGAAYSSAEYRALSSIPGVEVIVHDDPDAAVDLGTPADPTRRRIVFLFHTTPEAIVGDDHVEGLRVTTGERRHEIAADLVVRSIGYRSTPIAGLPFDDGRGVFPNVDGRLVGSDGAVVPGAYVAGWARRGPRGGIGANKVCAESTVELFLKDAADGSISRSQRSPSDFESLLRKRKRTVIGYRGVRAIDRAERRAGAELERPRVKFTTVGDMVRAAGRRAR
ncbi:4Fe-4S ferredoxin [Williamsia sp. 1138]|uniref:FAD-dependent oxidoreductase n=1 Tax=Williamsia sp. 1138 TaxID=1903117 RepID=UPI000A0F460C|nr:FAD-dependent oxidoreductase [Williamsia sp. 1138]OZG30644.1 4Fe-4S ferredoxin [Williamsia sp. 1138]